MDQVQFNREVDDYMKLVVSQCGFNTRKAKKVLEGRLAECEKETLAYAMNYCALQIIPDF